MCQWLSCLSLSDHRPSGDGRRHRGVFSTRAPTEDVRGVKGEYNHVRSRSPTQKGVRRSGVVVIGSLVFSEHCSRKVVVSYSCPLQGMGLGYPCSTPSRIPSCGSRQAARPVCVGSMALWDDFTSQSTVLLCAAAMSKCLGIGPGVTGMFNPLCLQNQTSGTYLVSRNATKERELWGG